MFLVPGIVLLAGILYISDNLLKVEFSEGFERAAWQLPQRTIESLRIQRGDQIADIGAGEGYFVFRLADAVGENGKVYAAADTIDITFTPNASTGTDYALSELTAGEIVFKFGIVAIDPNA